MYILLLYLCWQIGNLNNVIYFQPPACNEERRRKKRNDDDSEGSQATIEVYSGLYVNEATELGHPDQLDLVSQEKVSHLFFIHLIIILTCFHTINFIIFVSIDILIFKFTQEFQPLIAVILKDWFQAINSSSSATIHLFFSVIKIYRKQLKISCKKLKHGPAKLT